MTGRLPALAVGVALALLFASWSLATAPFNGPDETAHYLRALSIANGRLLGPRGTTAYELALLTPPERDWVRHASRLVLVPPRLAPPDALCVGEHVDSGPGPCREPSSTGDYPPLAYLPAALALKLDRTARGALWLGRLLSAAACLAFLLIALALLWTGSIWSIAGVLAAVTPMVLFLSSVVNPNGLEICACLALTAAVLRVARAPERVPPAVWTAGAAGAVVAALAWQLGPVYVLLDLALGAALLGRDGLRSLAAGRRPALLWCGTAIAAALVAYVAYSRASGSGHLEVALTPLGGSVRGGVTQLGHVLRQAVGAFGPLSVYLSTWIDAVWWALVGLLVGAGMRAGASRRRIVLAAVAAVGLLFPVLFYAWVYRLTGFGLQGRYVLPVLMAAPLVAGELVFRRFADRPWPARARPLVAAAVVAIAAVQLIAWWVNARHWSGAPHAVVFQDSRGWAPPLGWWTWTAAVAASVVVLAGLAVRGVVRER